MVLLPPRRRMSCALAALLCVAALAALLLLVWLASGSSACRALAACDQFRPVCASNRREHQFFYSECDMARENCMTGANWRRDRLSHCNVHKA